MDITFIGPATLGGQPSVLLVSVHRGAGERLVVRVEDDGWGPLPGEDTRPTPSLFLKTAWLGCRSLTALDLLEAQVEALGGSFAIGPSRLGGLAVSIRLPPERSEEELLDQIACEVRAIRQGRPQVEIEHRRDPGKASWFLRLRPRLEAEVQVQL